jgi:aryl-alcohol dehydrogenase-like predicted oxidoreductase
VTVVIPGAKSPAQAKANADAASLGPVPSDVMARAREIYATRIEPLVRDLW